MYLEKNKAACRRFVQQMYSSKPISPDSLHRELGDASAPAGHGPEGFTDMMHLYRRAFPDLQVDIQEQIAESDRVVTCLRMQGTQTGPLLGMGASGKMVDVNGIRVDRLVEGEIVESWSHWDGLRMLRQIGALPDLASTPQAGPWAKETTSLPTVPTLMPFPTSLKPTEAPRPSAARFEPAA
jgi:steroid delta-isomerase-like uncharacterized protein